MKRGLTRLVHWAHQFLREVLQSGDLAVDLTAGKGRDTLFLAEQVGISGCVLAFDIQEDALLQTAALLDSVQIASQCHICSAVPAELPPGVHLFLASHTDFARYLPAAPVAIIANLGYLPGSDGQMTTQQDTTLQALRSALTALKSGGRIVVVAYVGHPGGRSEAAAVTQLFAALPSEQWQVLRLGVENLAHAPFLLVAGKK